MNRSARKLPIANVAITIAQTANSGSPSASGRNAIASAVTHVLEQREREEARDLSREPQRVAAVGGERERSVQREVQRQRGAVAERERNLERQPDRTREQRGQAGVDDEHDHADGRERSHPGGAARGSAAGGEDPRPGRGERGRPAAAELQDQPADRDSLHALDGPEALLDQPRDQPRRQLQGRGMLDRAALGDREQRAGTRPARRRRTTARRTTRPRSGARPARARGAPAPAMR